MARTKTLRAAPSDGRVPVAGASPRPLRATRLPRRSAARSSPPSQAPTSGRTARARRPASAPTPKDCWQAARHGCRPSLSPPPGARAASRPKSGHETARAPSRNDSGPPPQGWRSSGATAVSDCGRDYAARGLGRAGMAGEKAPSRAGRIGALVTSWSVRYRSGSEGRFREGRR